MVQSKVPMVWGRRMRMVLMSIHTAWNGSIHVRPPYSLIKKKNSVYTNKCRRRNAHLNQPNQMAHRRWCSLLPTRLVPRPLIRLHLHQHGPGHGPSQHEPSRGEAVCHLGPDQRAVSGHGLSPAGAVAGRCRCEDWRPCDDPGD